MRRFYFDRQTDVSGTSGTGAVVEGVQFSDGTVVLRWLTYLSSISIYKSIEDCIEIHGHDGSTNLHWVDDEPSQPPTPTERPAGWYKLKQINDVPGPADTLNPNTPEPDWGPKT